MSISIEGSPGREIRARLKEAIVEYRELHEAWNASMADAHDIVAKLLLQLGSELLPASSKMQKAAKAGFASGRGRHRLDDTGAVMELANLVLNEGQPLRPASLKAAELDANTAGAPLESVAHRLRVKFRKARNELSALGLKPDGTK